MTEESRFWTGVLTGDAGPYSFEDMNEIFRYGLGGGGTFSGVFRGSGSGGYVGLQVVANTPAAANILVQPGAALVHGSFYKSTAVETLAIAANSSGNPRVDSVVLTKLWATQTVRLEILQGTPAGSPVQPSLTQSSGVKWQLRLADIAVANGFATIVTGDLTDRSFSVIPRVVTGIRTTTSATTSDTLSAVSAETTLTINIQSTRVRFNAHAFLTLATPASSYAYYQVYDSETGGFTGLADGWGAVSPVNNFGMFSFNGEFSGLTPGTHIFTLMHKVTNTFTLTTQRAVLQIEELRD
jgi:hypothetical protein